MRREGEREGGRGGREGKREGGRGRGREREGEGEREAMLQIKHRYVWCVPPCGQSWPLYDSYS